MRSFGISIEKWSDCGIFVLCKVKNCGYLILEQFYEEL